MPWDEDGDWVSDHLDNRQGLHFSLVSGSGDQATTIRLDEIVARAEQVSVIRCWIPSLSVFSLLSGPP